MGEVFTGRVFVKRGDNYKLLGTISKHLGEDTQFCAEVINKYSLRRQNKLLGPCAKVYPRPWSYSSE